MTVFYRSRELVINTDAFITVLAQERYALGELSQFHVVRGEPDATRRTSTHAAAGALVLAATAGPLLDSPAGWIAAGLAVVMSVSMTGLAYAMRRPRWQLMATHLGSTICLYSTTDVRTFNQVKRGLVRALEARRRHSTGAVSQRQIRYAF